MEKLQASLATVEHEKEELVTGFNNTKQEFMMSDFEKSGRIESLEKEIAVLQQQLDGWAGKELEMTNSQSLKVKELEECKFLVFLFFNSVGYIGWKINLHYITLRYNPVILLLVSLDP